MAKFESRIAKVEEKDEVIFNFLADFNNYEKLIPADRVRDWESTPDKCSFTVDGLGHAGLEIIEREAHKLIKINSDEQTMLQFTMWIQLKQLAEPDTRIKISLDVNINSMMLPMVKKPLQEFIDSLVEQLEKIPFKDLSGQ